MNRSRIAYTNEQVPWYYAWNPCGFGCSRGCGYCWSRALVKRFGANMTCEKCRAFEPHLHPERLDEPAKEKRPGVVLVDFTGEILSNLAWANRTFDAASDAPWHEYVFLTHCGSLLNAFSQATNWHMGISVTVEKDWRTIQPHSRRWLSLEPFQYAPDFADVDWCSGVIIGSEQQGRIPCDLEAVERVIRQCQAKNIPVYVKHLPKRAPAWMLGLKYLPWTMPKGTT